MSSNSIYRPDIDGLRAVAILTVVAYHAGIPGIGGGFVGVDVFFVISGFLITRLLSGELRARGRISFRDFYARRMRRLLPAFLAVLAVTILVWAVLLPGRGDTRRFSNSVRWAAMGLANLYFKRNTGGYFDGPTAEMPLLHLWSLAVEEQFYLVWPLLLSLIGPKRLRPMLVLLIAVSLGGAQKLIASGQSSAAFYLMPWRAWELAVGTWVASRQGPIQLPSPRVAQIASAIGLGSILAAAVSFSGATPFPGFAALLPVVGSALVIWSGSQPTWVSRLLSRRPLVRIGLLSYGWYLWHWPILAMARAWNLGQDPSSAIRLGLIALSLALAEASLRWIETPVRTGRFWREVPALRMVGLGLAANAVFLVCGGWIPAIELRSLSHRLGGQLVAQVMEESPALECFEQGRVGTSRCEFSYAATAGKPSVAIWGDSHACSYFPMVDELARARSLNVTPFCAGNTPPLIAADAVLRVSGNEKDALALASYPEAIVWDLKRKLRTGPVSVVLVSRWERYSHGSSGELARRLRETVSALQRAGVAKILIVLPYPEFKFSTFRCLLSGAPESCKVPRQEVEAHRRGAVQEIEQAIAGLEHVRAIDPLDAVCSTQECPQVLDGVPVVADDNHPTVAAVRKVGARYKADLEWLAL